MSPTHQTKSNRAWFDGILHARLDRLFHPAADPFWMAFLHLSIAGGAYIHGMDFYLAPSRGYWDWVWQAIPLVDLTQQPWQSFWYLHAQPPLFSLWGWFWLQVGGPGHFPDIIQLSYVLAGSATVAMTCSLARGLTGSRRWALAAGTAMAVNPSLLYYEAYLVYEPLVIVLVTATAWTLWKTLGGRRLRWLAVFAISLNLLVMLRSLYHWVFLMGALAFAWPLWRAMRPGRRWIWIVLAVATPGLWMAKNAAQWGNFSMSSWFGMGLYKCAQTQYTHQELRALHAAGLIPEFAAERYPYQHDMDDYKEYGFDKTTPIDFLSRDNLHNINMPDIGRAYGAAAMRLIRHDPVRYLGSVYDGYVKFSRPPTRHVHMNVLVNQHIPWESIVSQILYGQWFTDQTELFWGVDFGSLFYFYFPAILIGAAWWAARRWRTIVLRLGNRKRMKRHVNTDSDIEGFEHDHDHDHEFSGEITEERYVLTARLALIAYAIYVSLYVAVISCLFENGENERFRFATEPLTLLMVIVLFQTDWRRWGRRVAQWLRPKSVFSRKSLDR